MPMSLNVALFITCLTDQFYPTVGIAVTKVLERLGCSVTFPENQTCCGQPFYNNGLAPEAAELAKRYIEIFEPYDYIVTPSGSCCAMVREHFAEILGDDPAWKTGLQRVHDRTFEFVEFLDKVLKFDASRYALPNQTTLTFHYTCHSRGIGLTDENIRMLKVMGNVDYRPMEKTDQCCGFGGTFAVKYPQISGAIVEDKAACIRATQADVTICNDAGCTMNISGTCNRHGVKTQVKHIAEILAEAMGLRYDTW